ncbi:MAG: hypothetical protein CL609_15400 [Anaerolineaceae bacterium]|nr:hypothetical protein [Anaerolineaceae bacterium]
MSKKEPGYKKKFNWRGFTLQSFLITILPLTVLLMVVAFGSQTLHHKAMRSLVGDRDLRTVRAASSSLERDIFHLIDTLTILSRDLNDNSDFSSLILHPEEISSVFDGGIALYTANGQLIHSTTNLVNWQTLPSLIPDTFKTLIQNNHQPIFSDLISFGSSKSYMIIGLSTNKDEVLLGAFSPKRLITNSISDLISSGGTTVFVISSTKEKGQYDELFQSGISINENSTIHPGISDALNGESGINYYQSGEGEHVIAFAPILPVGWGLIIEETWEEIANPYLNTTQSAPLVFVPAFLLALIAIWFGVSRIVKPLQKLEKQANSLAAGNFEEIRHSVGGIEEIQNLQSELIEMAEKLKGAQQNLRSYIGAITAGIENERRSLARDMHDDTIQALIALNQQIQIILMKSPEKQKNELSELQSLVKQIMSNLRRMIRGLRPIYLEDLGLVASLEMLVREMEQTSNLSIFFNAIGVENRFTPQVEMSLYRMVQESLNNVIHHAEAKHAWVEIKFTNQNFSAQIRDDGKGFMVPDNSAEFPQKGHFGLLGLKERSELINAELEIKSLLNKGTTISIRFKNSSS